MRFCILLICMTWVFKLSGQRFEEGFEGDLSDWQILRGNALLPTSPIIEGIQSLRLSGVDADSEGIILHSSFSDNYGRYQYFARGNGPSSDADFYFQYIDTDNYFIISHKPANTDNPEFSIAKVFEGQYTLLSTVPPVADRNEWIKVDVERLCEGEITISVNDVTTIDIIDTELIEEGTIGFRAWSQFSYFDSLTFMPAPPVFESLNPEFIQTCTGSGYAFGNSIYLLDGIYTDTLATTLGCDSIVTIDLEFVDDTMIDTIFDLCQGDSILVGTNYYSTPDISIVEVLSSSAGCDSIVQFMIRSTQEITSERDTTLCMGDTLLINNQVITTSDTIIMQFTTASGCDSISILNISISSDSLDLGMDSFLCFGDSLVLAPGIFQSYQWNDNSTNSNLLVLEAGTYSLTVVSDSGCQLMDDISFVEQCELAFLSANIFSPNGDMINDEWIPSFNRSPLDYTIRVYDRWGGVVFESRDPFESWTGRKNGIEVPNGVYTWSIDAEGQALYGDITIIR